MIGIFDSGIGGLTVVKSIIDHLPEYDITYFGDTARTPYGTKSCNTILKYASENTQFLLDHGAKIIVIACNTASSIATKYLRQKYNNIIPVFEVISPAVKLCLKTSTKNRIGVIGTRATINSNIYEKKIVEKQPSAKVFSVPCPLLVPLVEEGWEKKPETKMILKKYLHPLKTKQIDSLILGCTHYPVLKQIIQEKIGKRVKIIDSSIAVTKEISEYICQNPHICKSLGKNNKSHFFVSDITDQFKKTAESILKKNIDLKSSGGTS